jgi:beta-xylosidase
LLLYNAAMFPFIRRQWFLLLLLVAAASAVLPAGMLWRADNGDGTYRNPVLFADYSDPDVIRVGPDYYLISSSFQCTPGIPVLHSTDLVNWRIIGHVLPRLPSDRYNLPRHGEGCWAPSLRYHAGRFWVYFGDPDLGIYMTTATDPRGPWEPPVLVVAAKGWIDPCPLWDDDGSLYLVHAWAKSRAGFNSVLTVNRLSTDGRRLLDQGVNVFVGGDRQPTIEGPKFYKRNGFYYIFAPAGGVSTGWQSVLRSRNILGPYEDRIVLRQGKTEINGPHQGAWIETAENESWFLHFQQRGAYGRVIHLQPMIWRDDWPVIGDNQRGTGSGEPVLTGRKPHSSASQIVEEPQTSDEFNAPELGLQWQWEANPSPHWGSLTAKPGRLRLFAVPLSAPATNLWSAPNLLLQKFPAPKFTATTLMDFSTVRSGDKAGLLVMGPDYAYLAITQEGTTRRLIQVVAYDADKGAVERVETSLPVPPGPLYLRVSVESDAACQFSFSRDGQTFVPLGGRFMARPELWSGAKIGLFTMAKSPKHRPGYADFDWFRVE